jgi:hypothetical protein
MEGAKGLDSSYSAYICHRLDFRQITVLLFGLPGPQGRFQSSFCDRWLVELDLALFNQPRQIRDEAL